MSPAESSSFEEVDEADAIVSILPTNVTTESQSSSGGGHDDVDVGDVASSGAAFHDHDDDDHDDEGVEGCDDGIPRIAEDDDDGISSWRSYVGETSGDTVYVADDAGEIVARRLRVIDRPIAIAEEGGGGGGGGGGDDDDDRRTEYHSTGSGLGGDDDDDDDDDDEEEDGVDGTKCPREEYGRTVVGGSPRTRDDDDDDEVDEEGVNQQPTEVEVGAIVARLNTLSTAEGSSSSQYSRDRTTEPNTGSVGGRRGMDPPEEGLVMYDDTARGGEESGNEIVPRRNTGSTSSSSSSRVARQNGRGGGGGHGELALLSSSSSANAGGFDHCYVIVPRRERLSALFATLRRSADRKVVVVCSTWESCRYHAILFRQLEMARMFELRENDANEVDLMRMYESYASAYPGILFASETSLREFDVPSDVDYVIQYEPPMDPDEYVYRMRTSRLLGSSCRKALLFLTSDEAKFLSRFEDGDPATELEGRKVAKFHNVVENLVSKHDELNEYAWVAYTSFVGAYKDHSHADIYDHGNMDLGEVLRSFGRPRDPNPKSSELAVVSKERESTRARAEVTKSSIANGGKKRAERNTERGAAVGGQNQKPGWMKTEKTWRERNGQRKTWKNDEHEGDSQTEKADQWKAHFGKERTWRTGHKTKSWMTKEKTWKHSHVHL